MEEAIALSGRVDVSARKSDSPYSQSNNQEVTDIAVKNMETPIKLTVPLDKYDPDAKCAYIDSNGKLAELEQPELNYITEDKKSMVCQSTHLTTFTLAKITYKP